MYMSYHSLQQLFLLLSICLSLSINQAHKQKALSTFNWFISDRPKLQLIDDASTLRAASVPRPPHLLAGQFILATMAFFQWQQRALIEAGRAYGTLLSPGSDE